MTFSSTGLNFNFETLLRQSAFYQQIHLLLYLRIIDHLLLLPSSIICNLFPKCSRACMMCFPIHYIGLFLFSISLTGLLQYFHGFVDYFELFLFLKSIRVREDCTGRFRRGGEILPTSNLYPEELSSYRYFCYLKSNPT